MPTSPSLNHSTRFKGSVPAVHGAAHLCVLIAAFHPWDSITI